MLKMVLGEKPRTIFLGSRVKSHSGFSRWKATPKKKPNKVKTTFSQGAFHQGGFSTVTVEDIYNIWTNINFKKLTEDFILENLSLPWNISFICNNSTDDWTYFCNKNNHLKNILGSLIQMHKAFPASFSWITFNFI